MSRTSARLWPLLVCLVAVGSLAAVSSLTKDDVIKMTREGRSEQAIVDALRDSQFTFDLTANDIADLRKAGVSEKVIDAMIETGPAQPKTEPEEAQPQATEPKPQEESPSGGPSGEAEAEPDDYYPAPPPIAYPVYPLYYPVYYPVYDPFFPFYGGFFSFSFVHVSRLVTVFPCDTAFVVFRSSSFVRSSAFRASHAVVFGTPRVVPRGATIRPEAGAVSRGGVRRSTVAGAPAPRGSWSRPRRLAGAGVAPPAGSRRASPMASRGTGTLRSRVAPGPAPRAPQAPRFGTPRVPPYRMASPRASSAPRLPSAPRFATPSLRTPRPAPVTGGGSHGFGGARGFGGPRPMSGPRGHGAHR